MRGIVLICIGVFSMFGLSAQDALYRITISSPLSINPAFAGSSGRRSAFYNRIIIANQFDQTQNRRNFQLSYDAVHHTLGGGLGFYASKQSIAGVINLYSANGIYNYILPITKKLIVKTAFQIGYESKSIDQFTFYRRLEFSNYLNQIDPVVYDGVLSGKPIHENRAFMTIGAGSIAIWHQLEIGISAFNINRPNWSFVKDEIHKKPLHYNFHIQHPIYNSKNYHILAKTLYSTQNNEKYFVLGTQLKSKTIMFGVFYQDYKNHQNKYQFAETSFGYYFKWFLLRFGLQQNLNDQINYKNFNKSLSLLYIFHTSSIRFCRPSLIGEKFPDNTF